MSERARFRTITLPGEDKPTKHKVVKLDGVEGFILRWTDACSGCFEFGECGGLARFYGYDNKAQCYVGAGCDECGYTGKRRTEWWTAFNDVEPTHGG